MLEIIQWIATLLVLCGSFLSARGSKLSFVFLNLSNVILIGTNIYTKQWYLVFMFLGFCVINTYGYYNWKKKKIGK